MDTLKKIVGEASIIVEAAGRIEDEFNATLNDMTPEDWRAALGVVEGASRRTYRLKKRMLDSAIEHSRARRDG